MIVFSQQTILITLETEGIGRLKTRMLGLVQDMELRGLRRL